jgi:hypothetical protein
MAATIGFYLSGVIAIAIIFIGCRFLLASSTAAAAYGVPAGAKPHLRAYLSAKGIRDIASGLFAAILKQPPNASGDQHRRRTFHRCRSWLIVPRISLNVPDQLLVVIALLERRK